MNINIFSKQPPKCQVHIFNFHFHVIDWSSRNSNFFLHFAYFFVMSQSLMSWIVSSTRRIQKISISVSLHIISKKLQTTMRRVRLLCTLDTQSCIIIKCHHSTQKKANENNKKIQKCLQIKVGWEKSVNLSFFFEIRDRSN